jgi:hypothetical protein
MPVYQIQCMAERCGVQHACVSDSMQGGKVQCAECLFVRYNSRQCCAVCSMPVSDTMHGSEVTCEACLFVRYDARQ